MEDLFNPQNLNFDFKEDEFERAFIKEKMIFSNFINGLLSDKEEGQLNHLALRFVSAWAKKEIPNLFQGKDSINHKILHSVFESLKERQTKLVALLKKIWEDENTPLSVQDEAYLISNLKLDSENFKEFISCCTLYDICFYKKNKGIIQLAMDEFKKDIPFFVDWLNKENHLLSIVNSNGEEDKKVKGIFHIVKNYTFAEAVLKNIPPEGWTNEILVSLGSWVLSKEASVSYIRDFAKKLEKCPLDKVKKYFSFLSDFSAIKEIEKENFSTQGILTLFSFLKNEKTIQKAIHFYEENGDAFMPEKKLNLPAEEREKIVLFLSKFPKGIEQLMDISLNQDNSLIWEMYAKNKLKKEDIERIFKVAMKKERRDFLLAPKPVHFSKDFPCYEELKKFFREKSSAQGTRFFNSFSWNGESVDLQCELLKDFVQSKAIHFFYFQKWNLFHHWAKEKNNYKILAFCYGENADMNSSPKLQISKRNLEKLWLQTDKDGKTPWHYICQEKDKIPFQKRFRELPELFIKACRIRDKDGKTPLDYALADSKFIKNLEEKYPQIKSILEGKEVHPACKKTEKKKESISPKKEIKLAPAIPVIEEKQSQVSELEQQSRIENAIKNACVNHKNLILKGAGKTIALSYSIAKEINEDEEFKKDIIEHIQKFVTVPNSEKFIIGNAQRWKTFKGAEGINELSINPKNGHSQSMPRIYFKKQCFKHLNGIYEITNHSESDTTIWVGVKKGSKRTQNKDAKKALLVRFKNDGLPGTMYVNDLDWHFSDIAVPEKKLPIRIFPSGNQGL